MYSENIKNNSKNSQRKYNIKKYNNQYIRTFYLFITP